MKIVTTTKLIQKAERIYPTQTLAQVLFALIHLHHCLWWSLAADPGEGTWHFSGLPSTHKHHANFEHRLPLLCVPEAKGDRASVSGSFVGCAADSTKNDVLLCLGTIGVIETFTQALLSLKLFLS